MLAARLVVAVPAPTGEKPCTKPLQQEEAFELKQLELGKVIRPTTVDADLAGFISQAERTDASSGPCLCCEAIHGAFAAYCKEQEPMG